MRRFWRSALVIGLLLMLVGPAGGDAGRDFAGWYQISGVTDLGGSFQLTLTTRVFNYSGADVSGATVKLEEGIMPGQAYGTFAGVSIPNRGSVKLQGTFTVPGSEYQRWQAGGAPSLWIEYLDGGGNTIRRGIEMAPMLGGDI